MNSSSTNATLNSTAFDALFGNSSLSNSTASLDVNQSLLWSHDPSLAPTLSPTLAPTWPPRPPANETITGVGLIESTDTRVLRNTIIIYGAVYLLLLMLFCIFRNTKRFNRYFNIRSWATEIECDIAKNSEYGLISWMWKVFEVDEDDILDQCGMDALCFIRVLRLGRKLAVVGCVHAVWLIPVYSLAEDSDETYYLEDPLVLISTAHLPTGSPRFLATVICAYTVFGYAMFLMKRELQWYAMKRHKFLSQRRPRNYAIYVAGIPEELRSGSRLEEFFRQSGASSSVVEAHIALACPELESLVAQRDNIKERLAHAKAFEEIHGSRERRLTLNLWGFSVSNRGFSRSLQNNNGLVGTVDSVEHLERKLRSLTKDVSIAYQNIERYNDPHSLEQHRDMVMQEIEELRHAERAQNIATRERVHSSHDVDHVEEIFHTEESSNEKNLPVDDKYSKIAEAFFFGDLKPSQQRAKEQERLLKKHEENDKLENDFHVTIRSCENRVHYMSATDFPSPVSNTPEFSEDEFHADGKRPSSSPSRQIRLVNNAFPSKSTISTVPGTFDNQTPNGWTRTSSFESSQESPNCNPFHPSSGGALGMPNIGEAASVSSDSESSEEDGLVHVPKVFRRRRKKASRGDSESSGDELKGSNRSNKSWSSSATSAMKRVSKGVQKVSSGVGKTVVDVGTGVGEMTKKVAGDVGEFGVSNVNKLGQQAAEFGVENIKTIRDSAAAVVPMVMAREEGKVLDAGFVVFKDLYSTQKALQMLHHRQAEVMRVEEAPGPDEIFWRNVGMPASAKRTGKLLSLASTVVLCLFWTVPVSFISALTEVDSLKESIPELEGVLEKYPSLEGVLALIAPLLLLILQDVLLPEFLMWFAAWEGYISSSTMEAAVFVKYAAFVLVQTFFISAISGSISAELTNMLNEPDQFVDFLANALPAQSNYFLQILVVAMAVTMGLEMLRVVPLGLAFVRNFVGPNLTEEERKKPWKVFTPLENPREFEHANVMGSVVLYFMVFFVYCCLAPVSNFFILIMFVCMESGYRYQFYHNYAPTPDSGGQHWKGCFHILQACMVVAQLTLIGFLILKKSLYAIPFLVPLLVVSILFMVYLNHYQLHVTQHLPTGDCVEVDERYRLNDLNFVKGKYVQPCIREALSDEIFEII